ncbi:hypothetical protein FRC02_001666 [Tulasnella sp. 418]|nr:hypothetical protein FRC02_001666 [Tulasnella sp. 418]
MGCSSHHSQYNIAPSQVTTPAVTESGMETDNTTQSTTTFTQNELSQPAEESPTTHRRTGAGRSSGGQSSNASPEAELKRERARERQRRKRARDRDMSNQQTKDGDPQDQQGGSPPAAAPPQPATREVVMEDGTTKIMTEEEYKRDKIRRAARDRQRKHRAILKAKRMSQLEDSNQLPFPAAAHLLLAQASPEVVLAFENATMGINAPDPMHSHMPPAFPPPPPNATPGQIFANTVLLALSCAPMLRTHLLRTLHMTNDDLGPVEQVIAAAWDGWDAQRRLQNPMLPTGPPPGEGPHPSEAATPSQMAQSFYAIPQHPGPPQVQPVHFTPPEAANGSEGHSPIHPPPAVGTPSLQLTPVQVAPVQPKQGEQIQENEAESEDEAMNDINDDGQPINGQVATPAHPVFIAGAQSTT